MRLLLVEDDERLARGIMASLEGAEFNAAVKGAMNERLRPHGLLVTRCELDRGARV